MPELLTESTIQKQQEKSETRGAVQRIAAFTIGTLRQFLSCCSHFRNAARSPLPGGSVDLSASASGHSYSGIAIAPAVLALITTAAYAQDKYSLKSPSGIAFSDFRGYEDWAVVSSARTDEVLKVIVANPIMIAAYKGGVPGNGQLFPEGSRIVKLQWKPKKSTEAPFVVDVPDVFTQAFVIEKDSKRFPK